MKLLVLALVFVAVSAAPYGYSHPSGPYGSSHPSGPHGSSHPSGPYGSSHSSAFGVNVAVGGGGCSNGMVLKVDGTCEFPRVTNQVYLFQAPEQPPTFRPPPRIPAPEVKTSILLIRTPEDPSPLDPIVLPTPQQKNIVYVLNKQNQQQQRVIEAPAPAQETPEVYYINYEDGDNSVLPGGISLSDVGDGVGPGGAGASFGAGGGLGGFALGAGGSGDSSIFINKGSFVGGAGAPRGPQLGTGAAIGPKNVYYAP